MAEKVKCSRCGINLVPLEKDNDYAKAYDGEQENNYKG